MLITWYSATVKGGLLGLAAGTAVGGLGVWAVGRRFHAFRQITVPFRAFLIASTGTFVCKNTLDSPSKLHWANKSGVKQS